MLRKKRKEKGEITFVFVVFNTLSSFGEDEGKTIDRAQGNCYTFGLPCVVLLHKSHVVLTKYHGQRCQHLGHRKLVANAENEREEEENTIHIMRCILLQRKEERRDCRVQTISEVPRKR